MGVLRRTMGTVALLAALGACSNARRPVRPDLDLHHPSGARRLEAVAAAAKSRDPRYVPALFDRLDDDDEAVRLAAAAALRETVGRDPGYRAFASDEERARMIGAWRAAVSTSPAPSGPTPRAPGYTGGAADAAPR